MPQFSMSAALKGSIAAGQGARFHGSTVLGRKAFNGHAIIMALPRKELRRGGALTVRAFEDEQEEPREWPYPKFVQGVSSSQAYRTLKRYSLALKRDLFHMLAPKG